MSVVALGDSTAFFVRGAPAFRDVPIVGEIRDASLRGKGGLPRQRRDAPSPQPATGACYRDGETTMADPARKRATYEDVLAAPPNLIAEVIFGTLYTQPRPAGPHTRAASVIGMDIGGAFDRGRGGPGGWVILYEPELHLGDEILVPDFAGWRRERMAETPATAFITLAPDWVCEVLSPSTEAIDRAEKMTVYAREGVRHAWLVQPVARILEVYRLQNGSWLRVGVWHDGALVRAEPFDAIELDLGALWLRGETAPR